MFSVYHFSNCALMNFGTFCFQIWSFWFPDCMFSISWWNFLISWFLNNFWFPDSWIYISWLNFIFPDFLDWISYFLISQFSVSWLNFHFPDFLIYFPIQTFWNFKQRWIWDVSTWHADPFCLFNFNFSELSVFVLKFPTAKVFCRNGCC